VVVPSAEVPTASVGIGEALSGAAVVVIGVGSRPTHTR
jgi:hypothetical protein